MNKNSNACHLRWKRCFRFVLALVKVSAFRLFFSSTISFGGQKSAVVAVSPLIVLVVAQVRSLRGPDVEAVIISSGSRESSFVDKEFLATEENLRSVRLIFSWHTKSGDRLWRTLLCPAECVQSSLMKLTVYPSGKFYYYMIMN